MQKSRIIKEAHEASKLKDSSFYLYMNKEALFDWVCYLKGPEDSPFTGGIFKIKIKLDRNYPYRPPKMNFMTKIFHPNIHFETGEICLEVLKEDSWSPQWSLESIMRAIRVLLSNPNADGPFNCDAGNLIRKGDIQGYEAVARIITKEYAIEQGEFEKLNDKVNGKGIFNHIDGARYEGEWQDDRQHGTGIEIWPDGAKFEGSYRNGAKNGIGLFKWVNGNQYEGNFVQNQIEGEGKYTWNNGDVYQGEWKMNMRHGQGKMFYIDQSIYTGSFENDQRQGYGELVQFQGQKYAGEWANDKEHGRGKLYQDGRVYETEWNEGSRIKCTEIQE